MEHKLEWLSEEEGRIAFYENGEPVLTAEVFITGEEAAEFKIQDVVFDDKSTKNNNLQKEIILRMTECLPECFRLLWEEGFNEVVLVEQQGTKIAETLNSTAVVQKSYSEYMMKCHFNPQNSTDCGLDFIKLTKTEDGYVCENHEKSFVCRLLSYDTEQEEEQSFYLYEVEVKKNCRNRGVATKCLTQLFLMLSQDAPLTVYLQVGSYNEPAVHLYKKLGFEISEELGYYVLPEE
ncbi:MAG: GNAT family N-acetyltransferase [Lachnospiraceae bacterium]|nr:GNAT family N-acetyltransferase [Lachnospiraceae bacterium]